MILRVGQNSWSIREGGVTRYTSSVASEERQRQGAVARDRRDVPGGRVLCFKGSHSLLSRRPEGLDKKVREWVTLNKW